MKIENTKAQMRKGILEFCILSIIRDSQVYASDIIDKLKYSKLLVMEGTVYPLLNLLKNKDLLSYQCKESSSGPARKYFSLTAKGETTFKELNETWKDLSDSVNQITKQTL